MGSIIFKTYKDIVNIKKRGNFKVEIIFKNRHEANRILKDETLKKFNLETFIPGFRKIRKGIIEGVPTNLSEEDILKACKSDFRAYNVKRLQMRNRFSNTEEDKWTPSQSILISVGIPT